MKAPKIKINRNINRYEHDLGRESRSTWRVFSDIAVFLPISIVVSCVIIIIAAIGVPSTLNYLKTSFHKYVPIMNELSLESRSEVNFKDLATDSVYFEPIAFLKGKGIINGYSDGTIKPGNSIKRSELIKTIVVAKNQFPLVINYNNCFSDVANEWFASAVCFAKEREWITGFEDGSFSPNSELTRAEALKILIKAFDVKSSDAKNLPEFQDVNESDWFYSYVRVAQQNALLREDPLYDLFKPEKPVKRGEAFQLLYRIMNI